MKLRLFSRIIVISLVVIVGGIMVVRGYLANNSGQATLQGTDLGSVAAPAFTLHDQNGAEVSLASLQGSPVALTFLSVRCGTDCPMATKLHTAMQSLGNQAQDVHWVVVSTNPDADTASAAQAFVGQHELDGLRYLLGDDTQLSPVWQSYHVAVGADTSTPSASDGSASQTVGLYLIDGKGRERVYLDSNFAPTVLEGDLEALL